MTTTENFSFINVQLNYFYKVSKGEKIGKGILNLAPKLNC